VDSRFFVDACHRFRNYVYGESMKTAEAWATETPSHATTAHKALAAKIAADRESHLANGGQIRQYGPTGRQIEYDWRDFTLGGREELERKRRKGGKKAQRVIELGRL
jgi:hypothetical protein